MDFGKPYKQIPDDFKLIPIFADVSIDNTDSGSFDYNSISIFKTLYEKELLTNGRVCEKNGKVVIEDERPYTGCEYSNGLYHYLAKEYLDSARALATLVLVERKNVGAGEIVLSTYANPCAFLCRHAIELKLKQCLFHQGVSDTKHHGLTDLWEKINKENLDANVAAQLATFIFDVAMIDPNGESVRYGTTKQALPINERTDYDCVAMVSNAMYLFNQLHIIAF